MKDNKIREIRLIRENPRFRRYPKYKASGVEWIGEIPRHWNLFMLKYAARLVYGDTLISENRKDGVVPVYGSNGIIDTHSSANTLAPAIVVGRKGSLGKVQYSDVPCFVIDTAYLIDRRTSNVNLRWLHYVLQALKLEKFRNSVLPGLNRESAESQYIPLISEEEQTQIANFLDRKTGQIDELIHIKERQIELLQEQRTALINQAVTRGLDPNVEMKPSGLEWIGEIPAHWEIEKIKHVATLVSEKSTPETDAIKISPENVESETGKVLDFYSSYDAVGVKFQDGDVLFNKIRVYLNKVVFAKYDGYSLGEMIVIRPTLQRMSKYLFYLMLSNRFIEYCDSISYGAKMPRTAVDDILNAKIPIPLDQEKFQIANFLNRKTQQIDKLIAAEQRKIELLKEYRQSLISEAVTGKIDVRNEV